MRTKDDLFDLEDILTLYQYLYLSVEHFITFNNGLTDLKMYMDDDFNVMCINMRFPDLPPLCYNEMLSIQNMLGIIDYLKRDKEHIVLKDSFQTRWEEIKTITKATISLNRDNYRR